MRSGGQIPQAAFDRWDRGLLRRVRLDDGVGGGSSAGTPGRCGEYANDVTAKGLSFPALIWSITVGRLKKPMVISPSTILLTPSTETRCGTCLMSTPAIDANNTPPR